MKSLLHKLWIYLKLGWRWYASQYRGKWYQRVITPIASFFVFFYLYLGAVDVNFLGLFGVSPTMEVIQNPVTNDCLLYTSPSPRDRG